MEPKYAVDISGLSDISELCRLCLTRASTMHALYSISENEHCSLFDKLQRLSAEPLNRNKKYPSYLCLKCVCTLNLAYLLTEQLKTTHQQLTEFFREIEEGVHKGDIVDNDNICTDNLSLCLNSESHSASYHQKNCGETNLSSLNHSALKLEPERKEIIVPDECIDDLRKTKEVIAKKCLSNAKLTPTDPLTENIRNVQNETHIKEIDANEKIACTEESDSHLERKRQFRGNSESTIQISKKRRSPSEEGSAIEATINTEDLFGDKSKDTQRSALPRSSRIANISPKKCRPSFSKPSKFKLHNQRCHQQLNITCNICSKSYPNLKALTGHVKLRHKGMLFECQKCMKQFKSSCTFKNHMNGHTTQDIYADVNNVIKSQVPATDQHVIEIKLKESEAKKNVMVTKNISEIMENITKTSNEFETRKNTPEIKHIERETKQTETKKNKPKTKTKQQEVNVSIMETKKRELKIIEGQLEPNKSVPEDGYSFIKTNKLELETKENTSGIQESKPESKKHVTRIVESIKARKKIESQRMGNGTSAIKESKPETQKTVTETTIHIPEHQQNTKRIAETKEITVVITDQKYDEKENTANSKNKPGRVKPHKCVHCSKNFSTKFKLHQHIALHKKESNICDVCGVGFVSKIRLEIHRMKYPGQVPCGLCVETFLNSRYLSMHMQLLHSTKSK